MQVLTRLSPVFYVALRRAAAAAADTAALVGGGTKTSKTNANSDMPSVEVSDGQLWAEIVENLDKGVATRLFAAVDPNTSGRRGEGDDVVFTCGHSFSKQVCSL